MDERVSWQYMSETYPDMWVAIREPEMDGPDVISGIIEAVLSDDEIIECENNHLYDGLKFRRTTEGNWGGIIESNFIIEVS